VIDLFKQPEEFIALIQLFSCARDCRSCATFRNQNDRVIAAFDANPPRILPSDCQNLTSTPHRSNSLPTIYTADEATEALIIRFQLPSSSHAQPKDQQVKAASSALPKLRASNAPRPNDATVQ
jgi:hypothetical protein